MKRVAWVTHLYPSDAARVDGVWIHRIARATRALGWDVRVMHVARVPGRVRDARRQLRVLSELAGRFDARHPLYPDVPSLHVGHGDEALMPASLRHLPRRLACSAGFRAWAREGFVPDVVHAVGSFSTGSACLPWARAHRVPLVLTEISSPYTLETEPSPRRELSARSVSYASRIIGITSFMEHEVLSEHPSAEGRTRVVPLPIDNRFLAQPLASAPGTHSPVRLATSCFFNVQKGLLLFLDALARIRRQGRDVRWVLIGDGPERGRINAEIMRLGLREAVQLPGLLEADGLSRILMEAHAFVLPSLHETQAVALAEGLAAGLPALWTKCGGPSDYMQESWGVGVPPGSAEALADGLGKLIDRLSSYDRVAIREGARAFSPEACGLAHVRVYEDVVGLRP